MCRYSYLSWEKEVMQKKNKNVIPLKSQITYKENHTDII